MAAAQRQEAAGIGLIKLPNGQQLEGYVLLTDKNLRRLGLEAALPDGEYEVDCTLTLRFGRKTADVAEAVEIKRVDDERASLHKEGAQHFISDDDEAEGRYIKGVLCLRRGDYDGANDNFKAAASKGHVSAYWNLAILIGSGRVTPFDIDYAADCFRAAAGGGHPTANKWIYMLDAADRGGFGYDNLERMIAAGGSQDDLPAILIVCACRFTHVLCTQHGVTDEVIDYELPAAAKSDNPAIREFVRRTGIDLPRRPMRWVNESPDDSHMEFFSPDLEEGSPADGITDGFNQITVALMRAGYSDELAAFARCTVLGYVISKSARGTHAKPLLGLEQFFEYEDEELDLTEK